MPGPPVQEDCTPSQTTTPSDPAPFHCSCSLPTCIAAIGTLHVVEGPCPEALVVIPTAERRRSPGPTATARPRRLLTRRSGVRRWSTPMPQAQPSPPGAESLRACPPVTPWSFRSAHTHYPHYRYCAKFQRNVLASFMLGGKKTYGSLPAPMSSTLRYRSGHRAQDSRREPTVPREHSTPPSGRVPTPNAPYASSTMARGGAPNAIPSPSVTCG